MKLKRVFPITPNSPDPQGLFSLRCRSSLWTFYIRLSHEMRMILSRQPQGRRIRIFGSAYGGAWLPKSKAKGAAFGAFPPVPASERLRNERIRPSFVVAV
jgi:hypothetical protein